MGEHRKPVMTTLDALTLDWVKRQEPTFGSVSAVISYWLRRARMARASLQLLPSDTQELDSNVSNAPKFPPRRVNASPRAPRLTGRVLRLRIPRDGAAHDWAGVRPDPSSRQSRMAVAATELVRAWRFTSFPARLRLAGSVA